MYASPLSGVFPDDVWPGQERPQLTVTETGDGDVIINTGGVTLRINDHDDLVILWTEVRNILQRRGRRSGMTRDQQIEWLYGRVDTIEDIVVDQHASKLGSLQGQIDMIYQELSTLKNQPRRGRR
jgi:hypothetical protein